MPTLTAQLIDKVLAVKYDTLPAAAIDMAKQVTLDGIAVMLAGATEPLGLGRIVTQYVKDSGGHPQASVIAGGFKTSMLNAAYANGTMAHALDFDNTWYPLNHPTSPTLPAILAIAEHHHCGGHKIIESIAAAFEVQGRMRMAATGLETGSGFHKPGTTGQFGAVTAAAKMLDLDRQQMLMAFGIAGSRAGSMSINTGTMTKSSHSGHAARMGVECAVLAKMGFTGNADVFGPKGFFDTFLFGKAEPHLLIENFGAPFRMVDPGVGFKKHPSNYFTHRPIDAALALREAHAIKPEQIAKVEVVFPRFDYVNRPQPETGLDGKFSVQYTTAIALLDGEITVDSFNNERRFAPDVVALLPKVILRFDDNIPNDFDRMHIDMAVTLNDGRVLKQRVDKLSGWIGSPLTREQRMKKFHSCARRVLSPDKAERIVALVEDLEQLQDVSELMTLVRG
ncbi:MAG TPA: MmgE/PrpD family protein [Burkholderiales bacterium]|nr:MmgE/PrpD family protein [Burkholderiales bacterium]